jgi:hypothetical protein
MPMAKKTRAEVEAKRGIVRDENGKIIRSKAWIKDKIDRLKLKKDDLDVRKDKVVEQIKDLRAQLKASKK